jgi:hypothetical protein
MSEWEQIQRKRNKYLKKYYILFRKALKKTIIPVIDELKLTGNPNVDIDALIKDNYIRETFIDLYQKVGIGFRRQEIKRMPTPEENIWADEMKTWCEIHCGERITSITQYQKKISKSLVQNIVDRGLEEGLTNQQMVEQLTKRLPREYSRKTMWMARRIVDTETLTASNLGVQKAAEDTGLNLVKEWITAPIGTATIERHTLYPGLNGQIRNMNEDFNVGNSKLSFPGDPKGLAEDVINCHCAIVHKRAEGI